MNILITGGTGFIGKNLITQLNKNKDTNILVISKSQKILKTNNVHQIISDLGKLNKFIDKIIDFKPLVVIHLAWEGIPFFTKKNCNINYINSITLAKMCLKVPTIKKFISIGSCLEYKKKTGQCFERNYLNHKDIFPKTKNKIYSDLSKIFNRTQIDFCWFRLFYAYGKGQREGSLIPSVISKLKNKHKLNFKKPYAGNDFVNIIDVVKLIELSIKQKNMKGIFNIGSGKSYLNYEIYNIIADLLSLENYKHTSGNITKDKSFYASMSKTNKAFKFKPEISIIDGIKMLIDDY